MGNKWSWEITEAGRPGMSGDIAKLFRHQELKAPGVFALDAPSAAATLLAREVIQNSWDAARELRRTHKYLPRFEITFRFRCLAGIEKRSLVDTLDLRSLAERVSAIDRSKIGLAPRDCLNSLDTDEPLDVLEITEAAASGMYGPWDQDRSHMYRALLSLGFTQKFSGAGGSYGYGKAGLINGSRIRSVVAYSCFCERDDDPGVTRRFLGVTYWGSHDYQGINHLGLASFSQGSAGAIRPFENEDADRIAAQLGLDPRTPDNPEDLGTTFLLIDTPIKPKDLVRAIERSWWPAILEGDFIATVVDYDGSTLAPRPRKDPVLRTFIDAWELAVGRSAPGENEYAATILDLNDEPAGKIGLVSDPKGWSYADHLVGPSDEEVSHRSLVALTRSPRMVVEYLDAGRTPPYVRGVFIADPRIDDLLRQTEPKAHDSWRTKAEEGEVAPEALAVAGYVVKKIKERVANFRNKIKPRTPPPEDINLPFFNDIMRRMMAGMAKGTPQPVPENRPLSIRLDYAPREAPVPGLVQVAGSVSYSLSERFKGEEARVVVTITYRFIEDDRLGDHARLSITAPPGFLSIDGEGRFRGVLRRDEEARFTFVSDPYDPNWSGRLTVNGEILSATAEQRASE
jgi:hypothetical protein